MNLGILLVIAVLLVCVRFVVFAEPEKSHPKRKRKFIEQRKQGVKFSFRLQEACGCEVWSGKFNSSLSSEAGIYDNADWFPLSSRT